jgi:hypothetical protein
MKDTESVARGSTIIMQIDAYEDANELSSNTISPGISSSIKYRTRSSGGVEEHEAEDWQVGKCGGVNPHNRRTQMLFLTQPSQKELVNAYSQLPVDEYPPNVKRLMEIPCFKIHLRVMKGGFGWFYYVDKNTHVTRLTRLECLIGLHKHLKRKVSPKNDHSLPVR